VLGRCVRAVRTVTFARTKLGMWVGEGPARCGAVDVVDIGLAASTSGAERAAAEIPGWDDLGPLWPGRPDAEHKGAHGHLLVVAGSAAMVGAAILTCRGALAAGIGRCTLVATRAMRPRLAALPPEVMVLDGGEGDVLTDLPDTGPYDALAVGPGLGGGAPLPGALARALGALWASDPRPCVFDADALPCTSAPGEGSGPRVLTPHPGEAGRLLGTSSREVQADRIAAAARLAERGVALLKGQNTVVAAGGAALPSLNPTGSGALATGGSGDVLTGVIGALLARGLPARDAARLGAFVHGRAGEQLTALRPDGWTASDVADRIPWATSRPPLP
jgi:ADP-dependent NAD(P)H-hydrate dehydratase / NAD(P)H-hydrate epimerase